MVQCVCLYACVLEVQISKTGDFSTFFFYSKKHDTVTINNHAFYTADACFRGQGKKKKSTQMEKQRCNRPLFYACNRAILYIMRKTGEGGVRFCLFLENIRSSHQWCTLVIRWLFIKNQTQLFTSKGDGVCILPAYELPFFPPHCEQRRLLQCNTLLCW